MALNLGISALAARYIKKKKKEKEETTIQGKKRTKAQLLAIKNKKKYGGTASAAQANKEAMRKKIKERYLAKKEGLKAKPKKKKSRGRQRY